MNLSYFSTQTLPKGTFGKRTGDPVINLGIKGAIRLNPAACELLGVTEGTKVSVAQDQDNPENWYIFLDPEHGYECRVFSDGKSYGFNHSALTSTIKECFELPIDKGVSFPIAQIPIIFRGGLC